MGKKGQVIPWINPPKSKNLKNHTCQTPSMVRLHGPTCTKQLLTEGSKF